MRKVSLLFAFILTALAGHAQSFNVHKTNGEVVTIPMTEVSYVDISDSDDTVGPPEGVEAVDLGLPSGTKWGGTWHMPTDDQTLELSQNCTLTWSKRNGVSGCLITSNKNGKSIFIPASGYRLRNSTKYSETIVGFWAEQPGMGSATAHAYPINITESACFIRTPSDESKNKYIGWPVRPVSD